MSTEFIRLNKRLAQLGICSRREADEYIARGWVNVNGQVAKLGQLVTTTDVVQCKSSIKIQQSRKLTLLVNKPLGYVSSQPEKNYPSAQELITIDRYWPKNSSPKFTLPLRGLAPAGRLDIDSTGLLVLTQDGRIANQIIGRDSVVEKEYLVKVSGFLSAEGLKLLREGLHLDGEALLPAVVSRVDPQQLRFVLRQGKKRQIRRMCELVGLKVIKLKRIRIGRISLAQLPLGRWRLLAKEEFF
ncbi:MAG: pseudouridine synthase [Neisseriaceae bacterium]